MEACYVYREFVSQHKGLFEVMQWYNMYQLEENASQDKVEEFFKIFGAYDLEEFFIKNHIE